MPKAESTAIVSRLEAISKRVDHDERRFRDCPLYVLWVSTEGPASNWSAKHIECADVADFLMIPQKNVVTIGNSESRNPNDWQSWSPFYAFFKPELVQDESKITQEISKQVAALKSVAASLQNEVEDFPSRIAEIYRLPKDQNFGLENANWWKILFHLAQHYSPPFRDATRRRWVKGFNDATKIGVEQASLPSIPSTDKTREFHFQIEDLVTPCEDIWPGTLWCELGENVFISTKQAIDLLILMVEHADALHPPPEGQVFAELLKEFEALATKEEAARDLTARPTKDDDEGEEEYYARYEPMLLRLGSSFSTPAVGEWCDSFSPFADKFIELSRWHNFAEVVTFRHMPPKFERLCEAAGELLPREFGVVPLMSPRIMGDGIDQEHSDFAVISSALKARWIRFVFDTLRRKFTGEVIEHFPPADYTGKSRPWAPYGYMKLKNGFCRASAVVIREHFLAVNLSATEQITPIPLQQNTASHGEAASYIDSLLQQSGINIEIVKKIRRLQNSHMQAIAEFLVAQEALRINAVDFNLRVTISEAHEWLLDNLRKVNRKIKTWERYVSRARKEIPELRVNRKIKESSG